jgi:DNA-3-methyladenine glycosylase II
LALPGIGPWTADIYVLAALGRADVCASGDLALQLAAQDLFALNEQPSPKAFLALAEAWRPWRSVAARLLWSHYRGLKGLSQAVN